jgi:hypothetical protein
MFILLSPERPRASRVKDLEARGVQFEDYNMPGLKTERHIASVNGDRAAWFKDTEGNILCIHQRSGRP